MITFDKILPTLEEALRSYSQELERIAPVVVNRDLNGRVRVIVDERWRDDQQAQATLLDVAQVLADRLGAHAFARDRALLYEAEPGEILQGIPYFQLASYEGVYVVDRLATDSNWASITPPSSGAPRIVFYSIKGGVGRSTALAAAAYSLAQAGKRVMVLDLDLESPGLSASLLPGDRQPAFGIADWLVEDLVDQGEAVFDAMVATSTLSYDGEIFVVPAHGSDPGEYIAKLGRAWMPKVKVGGSRETWSERLRRLMNQLEAKWQPDVMLIDSRAGIDEIASTCVTDLGATLVLFFALDGGQTWSGYRILFRHWHATGVVREIRERLQVVGAMVPDVNGANYFDGLRERSWDVFAGDLYDEIPPGMVATEDAYWSFDQADESAPHYPWPIRWHRGFSALRSLHERMERVDAVEVEAVFGSLINGLSHVVEGPGGTKVE